MKNIIIGLGILLLSACASTSDVKDLELQVRESKETIAEFDNKIIVLEGDRSRLVEQLASINTSGNSLKSEAAELRGKITIINQSITSYKSEISSINSGMASNTANISAVKTQQKTQHIAAAAAVKENQDLINQTIDEIRALEQEYKEKRDKANEDQYEIDDNQGE